jgi:hypothetical protein
MVAEKIAKRRQVGPASQRRGAFATNSLLSRRAICSRFATEF